MIVMMVDDEQIALDNLQLSLQELPEITEVHAFRRPEVALEWLSSHPVDVVFSDIEMRKMDGITFAKKCKELSPDINIIFVTGYNQYAMEALRLHASGYLIKPVQAQDLQNELDNLRHPPQRKAACRVRIQAFGNFEVFIDQKPLPMPLAKCRECLAYLVDRRGARVTTAELAAQLWEDRPFDRTLQNNTHRVISDLMKGLREAGIEDIVIKTRKDIAIDPDKVDCDYFGFLQGDVSQINTFRGEYMTNYSWAEFTLAELVKNNK